MEPVLTAGDNILVNKTIPGARIFNLFASLRGHEPTVRRLPGIRKIKHNDIVVFNNPYSHTNDSIHMDIMKYYVKRCIGLPGDSIYIKDGVYGLSGNNIPLGEVNLQKESIHYLSEANYKYFLSYPKDSVLNWNVLDFGPLYIPAKGNIIPINRNNIILYRKIIEWEQKAKLNIISGDTFLLHGKPLSSYIFQHNYYFMAGDNVQNSQDSRYWGLLPDDYIVGKAWFIWKSIHPYTDKIRWDRFLQTL